MIKAIKGFASAMFGSSKATDTAIDALRKMGGLDDMNGKEKAEWLINYAAATKHQSPARRFIAMVTMAAWALLIVIWLIARAVGIEYPGAAEYAKDVYALLVEIVLQPHSIIVGAYFVVQAFKGK